LDAIDVRADPKLGYFEFERAKMLERHAEAAQAAEEKLKEAEGTLAERQASASLLQRQKIRIAGLLQQIEERLLAVPAHVQAAEEQVEAARAAFATLREQQIEEFEEYSEMYRSQREELLKLSGSKRGSAPPWDAPAAKVNKASADPHDQHEEQDAAARSEVF
jgi:chromosome segregation ATPase